jgi:RimJ/RimL family protein N-acetyltransferase
MRFMGGPRVYADVLDSIPEAARVAVRSPVDIWSVVESSTARVIGNCGLVDKDIDGRSECELVYLFIAAVWCRGYATEAACAVRDHAFSELGKSRLVALIDPSNGAAARVALKAGFAWERDTMRPDGRRLAMFVLGRSEPLP